MPEADQDHLFRTVKTQVSRAIVEGRYTIGAVLPGVPELARKHKCSAGTVRRALTELASSGIVQRIRSKGTIVRGIPKLGRVCLLLDRDKHTNMMVQDKFYAALVEAGFDIEMVPGGISQASVETRIRHMRQGPETTDYLVWVGGRRGLSLDHAIASFPHRILYSFGFGNADSSEGDWLVSPDLQRMARIVVQHLLDLGHKRIAVTCGMRADTPDTWARITSDYARDLIEIAGAKFFPYYYFDEDEEAQLRKLTHDEGITALWALNDYEATKAQMRCMALGLRVPDDIAIVGRWDTPWSLNAPTPLTSVSIDADATAHAVAQIALRIARGETDETSARPGPVKIPPVLVPRDSTARPNRGKARVGTRAVAR
jgi:DNA-binding transcriptional regulator YhcF (GntR family)